jgi:hypothetical protein
MHHMHRTAVVHAHSGALPPELAFVVLVVGVAELVIFECAARTGLYGC